MLSTTSLRWVTSFCPKRKNVTATALLSIYEHNRLKFARHTIHTARPIKSWHWLALAAARAIHGVRMLYTGSLAAWSDIRGHIVLRLSHNEPVAARRRQRSRGHWALIVPPDYAGHTMSVKIAKKWYNRCSTTTKKAEVDRQVNYRQLLKAG